ncbi:MAG TPA: SEC59/DGK1/VTE5 family protein [Candidatus Binatia bacterium]
MSERETQADSGERDVASVGGAGADAGVGSVGVDSSAGRDPGAGGDASGGADGGASASAAPSAKDGASADAAPGATRSHFQPGRRLFHLANGVVIATAYALLLTREQLVQLFGVVACLVYIVDRVRIHYPELAARVPWINRTLLRAEEQAREAAMTPYAIAILLTILTFPKPIALIAIYTLAIADPLSAVVGIRFGRHRLIGRKTLEGSLAFFAATFAVSAAVLAWGAAVPVTLSTRLEASFVVAALGMLVDALPVRIDDNITIPLGVAFGAWATCGAFGIAV